MRHHCQANWPRRPVDRHRCGPSVKFSDRPVTPLCQNKLAFLYALSSLYHADLFSSFLFCRFLSSFSVFFIFFRFFLSFPFFSFFCFFLPFLFYKSSFFLFNLLQILYPLLPASFSPFLPFFFLRLFILSRFFFSFPSLLSLLLFPSFFLFLSSVYLL